MTDFFSPAVLDLQRRRVNTTKTKAAFFVPSCLRSLTVAMLHPTPVFAGGWNSGSMSGPRVSGLRLQVAGCGIRWVGFHRTTAGIFEMKPR